MNMKVILREWYRTVLVALFIAFIVTAATNPTMVKGHSMGPTIKDSDYLMLNKLAYKFEEPSYGDIIVFKSELEGENGKPKKLIKRVIGTEGDEIEISKGKVYRNGEELIEPYIGSPTNGELFVIIGEDKVFVMGDNRIDSLDSRNNLIGQIDISQILGKVYFRIFPLKDMTAFWWYIIKFWLRPLTYIK